MPVGEPGGSSTMPATLGHESPHPLTQHKEARNNGRSLHAPAGKVHTYGEGQRTKRAQQETTEEESTEGKNCKGGEAESIRGSKSNTELRNPPIAYNIDSWYGKSGLHDFRQNPA